MQLTQNIRANRIQGTLQVHLDDGRTATLEVDLDVSHALTQWGVKRVYSDEDLGLPNPRPTLPLHTTYALQVPTTRVPQASDPFTLRIPAEEAR